MPEWSIPSEVPMGEESPRLSTGSSFSSECLSTGTMSDSSILIGGDLPENERPMSLVSTVSSSSNSSKEEQSLYRIYTPLLGSTHSMDLEPGPSEQPRLPSLGDDSDEGGTHYTVQVPKNNNATEHTWTDHSTQSHCSSSTAKSMAPSTKLSYLDRVVMEIVETERTYVRDLRSIVEDYLAHIIDTADLPILPEQVGALFGNIEDIYEFNSELLQTLDMCDNDPVAIARCFVHKTEYFEIYTQYCTNYPNSVAVLTECMRSKTLSDFFRDRQAMLEHSLPLGSYLLKPVQRILKYHLLLQEIAKHFDPEEEGYEEVEEAIYTMTGVAWYINDMKRKHEHAVRLQEVQSLLINWKGPDLTTYGELVLEGTFRVHHSKNERTFFLFERMLLITKKRGEHYVYKTHISCATLMLIESAKDSLCFSVTHYRHPKQPHTVQAKTVEERKLWAFHIKRLILENHQAIIPQKAKDAFQMDSIYPKYRYSPDRLKKAMSWQPDDLTAGVHLRRGQSDPAKQTLQGTKDILKTDHSAGVLGFSLPEPEAERPDMEKETEKMGLRKDSFERQISAESNEPISGLPDLKAGREEEKEWETDSEDIFLEDDQMEDFASSMLAAISCWHYRVRALLSTGAATDKEEDGIMEDKLNVENNQPSCQDESCVTSLDGSLAHQDTSNGALPHSPASQPDLKERPEEDLSSDLPVISRSSLVTPGFRDGQAAEKQKPDHVTQQAGQKRISSEDSGSEDEEESRPDSILPSSVLGQASVIAEHFLTSTRRGSLHSLAGPCHMHTSRSGSAISLNTEFLEKVHRLHSNPTELRQILCHQDSTHTLDTTMIPPRANSLFDGNGMPIRRQDSSLSRQDQLLIDKIRSYYENAEYKEASFSGQRRESLTFIPTGLVQDSVRQLNNIPKDEVVVRETESVLPIISASSTSSLSTTGNANDTSRSGKKQHSKFCDFGAKSFVGSQDSVHKSQIFQGIHLGDKEFQPYNKTVDVWREKEREFGRSLKKPKGAVEPRLGGSHSSGASLGMRHTSQTTSKIPMTRHLESLVVFKNMDLDGCIDPQRILGHADNRDETQIQCSVRQDYIPRPASCQINVEEVMQMQDEKAKTKVFQLARQYSQLAKTTERIPEQNGRDSADLHKDNVPSVLEERLEDENRVLPRSPSPVTSHRDRSPSYTCPKSPASPTQTESFNWPDVRELRSKYTIQEPEHAKDALEPLPWTLGRGHRRCSSSSSTFVFSQAQADMPQRWESCRQRICSDESLDRGLFELPKAHGTERCPSSSHAVEEKVVVVADQADRAEVCKEGGGAQGELRKGRHLNYGQTGSPTFHEKSSAMAYTEHDRTDQQREECRQWEHGNAIGPLATRRRERRKRDQGLTMHKHLEHTQKTVIKESDTGQPSKVKDLREKFLSMTYNSYTL